MTAEREAAPRVLDEQRPIPPALSHSRRVRKKGKKLVIRNGSVFHPPAQLHLHRGPMFHEREPHSRASAGTAGASWLVT